MIGAACRFAESELKAFIIDSRLVLPGRMSDAADVTREERKQSVATYWSASGSLTSDALRRIKAYDSASRT